MKENKKLHFSKENIIFMPLKHIKVQVLITTITHNEDSHYSNYNIIVLVFLHIFNAY